LAATRRETIFVSIASYRDVDCQWTIRDLFEQAAHPERVFVGVCWQWLPEADGDCFDIVTRPAQVRERRFHISESRGACWARGQAQGLWQGEDYVLQLDAHHRFAPRWDETLIELLRRCPSERPFLSSIALGFRPPRQLSDAGPGKTVFKAFHRESGIPCYFSNLPISPEDMAADRLLPTPFVCGHFLFSPAEAEQCVPWDPHIHMKGDEIVRAARFWTHGWDGYAPSRHILWHDWQRVGRAGAWRDEAHHRRLIELSARRVRHLLGIEKTADAEALLDIADFGFGSARSLDAFQDYCGIRFKERLATGPALTGDFPPHPPAS
jgi:hypothetical protein